MSAQPLTQPGHAQRCERNSWVVSNLSNTLLTIDTACLLPPYLPAQLPGNIVLCNPFRGGQVHGPHVNEIHGIELTYWDTYPK